MGSYLLAAVGETWPPPSQASRLTTMQVALLVIISLAHEGALAAPVGATESSVAQAGLPFPALGAPRTFDLFYPELPTFSSRGDQPRRASHPPQGEPAGG